MTVPVRDEAPILPRFLSATLLWADAVIVADQGSTDDSAEIARAFPRVTVIDNRDPSYSEVSRARQLVAAARREFPGRRFLVALDADELLSANVVASRQWDEAVRSPPGTCLRLARVELCENLEEYFLHWSADKDQTGMFAYADDGAPVEGPDLHAVRLPEPDGAPQCVLDDVVVLHLARANRARAKSKDRWYQCYERLHHPERTPLEVRRRYDWYERRRSELAVRRCPDEWFAGYRGAGLDLSEPPGPTTFWTDWDVLRMFAATTTEPFARLDVWDFDWESLRREGLGHVAGLPSGPVERPDGLGDRLVRAVVARSPHWRWGRWVDRALIWAERPMRVNLAVLRRITARALGAGRRPGIGTSPRS